MKVWSDTFKELKGQYMQRASERIAVVKDVLRRLARDPADVAALRDLMRQYHWFSGSGGTYGFPAISKYGTHGERLCEELLADENRLVKREDWDKLNVILESIVDTFGSSTDQRDTLPKDFFIQKKPQEILVVDADESNTLMLARLLEEYGLAIRTVSSAQAAFEWASSSMPAGFIVILPLPDSGYELIEKLRSLEGGDKPPIIVISNKAGFIDKVNAIHSGADNWFEFPVDWESLISRLRYLLDRSKPNKYRILSVEDDPDQAAFIKAVLESAGYQVYALEDPKYFEEAIVAVQPDLLLLDIMLPTVTGFELSKYVRQDERYATLPILFLSTQNALEAHIESARSGADDHLIKPIAPQLLLSAVASRLERARFLKSLLHRDGLTKLLMHSAFMEEAESVVAQCKRNPNKLACLFILDIDDFSEINRKYGFQVGDRVLTALATVVRRRLRQSDSIGRYSGKELIGIVDDLEEEDAVKLATRLLEDFSKIEQKLDDGTSFHATFTAGLCMFEPSVMDLERWRRLTEQAVKAGKNQGKNCVMMAQVGRKQ